MITFNIFGKLQEELEEYFTGKIKIGGGSKNSKREAYEFSQYDTIEVVDYYTNSKFELGDRDSEGQQKFFINEVAFRKDVASKNIDIDTKHFSFTPEEGTAEFGAVFLRKMFRKWVKQSNFGEFINELVDLFPKYGTLVLRDKGKELENIPLQTLRSDAKAKTLQDARYVIIEHADLSVADLEKYPNWDLDGLKLNWDSCITVYERYGFVPLAWYKEYKGEKADKDDEKKVIKVMTILAPDADSKDPDGKVLFCEEVDELPFSEVHYERQHGRWLGIGEVEKQFENQKIRNMVFNLRKKSLAWSAKNIFQTQDDTVINSLVREVRDGDLLKISTPNGIMRVDTSNRSNADFNSVDTIVTDNANQRAFSFEVATGEELKSNTPFRLGALQSQEVNKYFGKKREQFGLFLCRVIRDYAIPQFLKDLDDETTVAVFANDEDFDKLRGEKKKVVAGRMALEKVLAGQEVDPEMIQSEIEGGLVDKEIDTFTVKKEDLKHLRYTVNIDATGESIDLPQKMETLTTLYTSLAQKGDPRAEKILSKIMILAGEKLPPMPNMATQPSQGMGQPKQAGGMDKILENASGEIETVG
jgi:hypothetical protein